MESAHPLPRVVVETQSFYSFGRSPSVNTLFGYQSWSWHLAPVPRVATELRGLVMGKAVLPCSKRIGRLPHTHKIA